jgi:putative ABC transport system permease protein
MWLLVSFSFLAVTLAAVGIYGVVSYSVAQRTSEIGVRVALGASSRAVLKMVLGQAMGLVAIGLAAGMALALPLTRLMSGLLFGVSPNDPLTFAVIAVLLGGVAFVACAVPARRATRVDPIVALRYE